MSCSKSRTLRGGGEVAGMRLERRGNTLGGSEELAWRVKKHPTEGDFRSWDKSK